MQDLKDVTRETHYENYRTQCIQSMTRMVVKERNRKYGLGVGCQDRGWGASPLFGVSPSYCKWRSQGIGVVCGSVLGSVVGWVRKPR